MAKTYRVTSETVNFSLVVPDSTTKDEVKTTIVETTQQIMSQQREALKQDRLQVAYTRVPDDDEEEDGSTMLGRLCADWFRNQQS